jgi:ketosteroid isomerase-like protein
MRKFLMGTLVLSTAFLGACEDKASTTPPAPAASASAAPSAATSTTAAPPKAPEGPKDHVARAKALSEAYASHDAKKVAALYTEDASIKVVGLPDVKGRAAIEKFAAFKDVKVSTGRIWAKDKHSAVMEWVFDGTNTGDAPEMGLPKATNRKAGFTGATWIEVSDDGFIKEERRYYDRGDMAAQLAPEPKEKEPKAAPFRPVVNEPGFGTKVSELKADSKPTAEETKSLEVENEWVKDFNAAKLDDAMKLMAKDVVIEDYTEVAAVKGDKEARAYIEKYLKAFPDLKATMVSSFAVGEFAIIEYRYQGTNKGALGTIKATNKPVDVHQIEVDEIKDGKFVKEWTWGNSQEMLGQMGLVPTPGAAPAPSGKAPPAAK